MSRARLLSALIFTPLFLSTFLHAADEADLTMRFTQVWVRNSATWLREAFQATPISTAERPLS